MNHFGSSDVLLHRPSKPASAGDQNGAGSEPVWRRALSHPCPRHAVLRGDAQTGTGWGAGAGRPARGEAGDFLCYDVVRNPTTGAPLCQSVGAAPPRRVRVVDQLGRWRLSVRRPRTICTPAVKTCHSPEC
jgi:hypothetical protein